MLKKIFSRVMSDSLYRNSLYLMASTVVTAGFGFIFWILNARLYTAEEIGIATTIISGTALIAQFSLLGLKNGIIRFLPESKTKNNKINTASNIVTIVALALSSLYIALLPLLSPKLLFLRDNVVYAFLFIIFALSFSLNQLQEGIFIAHRSTKYLLFKNVLWGIIKIALPILLVGFGAFGIFFAFSLGSVISFLLGLYFLIKTFNYTIAPVIKSDVIKKIGRYSLGDYLGIFFAEVPYFVIPLLIINHIGAKESAYYYIDLQIATFLFMIPVTINQSLFAEGSNDEKNLKRHMKKAFLATACLMIPAILITVTSGYFVLNIFGNLYAEQGLLLLRLLAVTGFFIAINDTGSTYLHIKKKIKVYVVLNFISALLFVSLSVILLPLNLFGIGLAALISKGSISLVYLFLLRKIFL